MKRFLSKFVGLFLGILFVGVCIFSTTVLVKNHIEQDIGVDDFIQITENMNFNFLVEHDNLNIVVLRMKNQGIANKSKYEIEIRDGDKSLVTQIISGSNVGDPSDLRIQFSPVADTKNKLLTIFLRPLEKSNDPLKIGINKQGHISLQTFYREHSIQPEFFAHFKDLWFLVVWGGTIALLIIYV